MAKTHSQPRISLRDYQEIAVAQLKTGSILQGGVGSGKSITALAYYMRNEYPKSLFIITTAAKRNSQEWEKDYDSLGIVSDLTVDSWNNIKKYIHFKNCFFIFDEQRVVGSGSWVKSFYKIAKLNNWILLSATPGDSWMDYIPVFVANRFYKNRTEFIQEHVVWNTHVKFPKVDRYIGTGKLIRQRESITVRMKYERPTKIESEDLLMPYDKSKYDIVAKKRWNPYNSKPVKEVGELCYLMRRVANSDPSRLANIATLVDKHQKLIVFYNFDYELEILRNLALSPNLAVAEYNGHKHESIPDTYRWVYLVNYMAGAEGWNCIETNALAFYSLHYSYRTMLQAAGRIDRLNTPFAKLFYYRLMSDAPIDKAILAALSAKKNFNELRFLRGIL